MLTIIFKCYMWETPWWTKSGWLTHMYYLVVIFYWWRWRCRLLSLLFCCFAAVFGLAFSRTCLWSHLLSFTHDFKTKRQTINLSRTTKLAHISLNQRTCTFLKLTILCARSSQVCTSYFQLQSQQVYSNFIESSAGPWASRNTLGNKFNHTYTMFILRCVSMQTVNSWFSNKMVFLKGFNFWKKKKGFITRKKVFFASTISDFRAKKRFCLKKKKKKVFFITNFLHFFMPVRTSHN